MKFGKKSQQNYQKRIWQQPCIKWKIYKNNNIKKIKSYNGKINRNLHNNKISREGSQCICLPVILIDSFYKKR